MHVVFPVPQTKLLTKLLESILDGSDTAFIKMQPDKLIISSIDTQRRGMHTCTFLQSVFTVYTVSTGGQKHRFSVTKLLKMLQSDRRILSLSLCDSQLGAATLKNAADAPKYTVITDKTDNTLYLQTLDIQYSAWDCFDIHSLELSTQVLELSTGGSYTQVALSPTSLELTTHFETGCIRFSSQDGYSHSDFQLIKIPEGWYSNCYFTKYLKQVYPLCQVSKGRVRGYMRPNTPLVLEFFLGSGVTVVFLTAPTVEPLHLPFFWSSANCTSVHNA